MKNIIISKLDGRTQRWLAMKINMTDVDLTNSLKGIRKFKPTELKLISKTLKIPMKQLMDREA